MNFELGKDDKWSPHGDDEGYVLQGQAVWGQARVTPRDFKQKLNS